MADEIVRLQTDVNLWSVGQLEGAFEHAPFESVFEFLRVLVVSKPILLTSDRGLIARCCKDDPSPKAGEG